MYVAKLWVVNYDNISNGDARNAKLRQVYNENGFSRKVLPGTISSREIF